MTTTRQVSQGTRFMIQSGPLPVGTAIVSATKAAPCVITFAGPPPAEFVVGALVDVQGSDWKSLDNRPFEIKVVTGNTVTLNDSNTIAETATFAVAATASPVPLSEACMATLTFTGPAGTNIDMTTMCDRARITAPGLPGLSTWQATGFWDASDAMQMRMRDLFRTRQVVNFECVFNDGSGLAYEASVESLDVRAGVDQPVAITLGGTLSGGVSFVGGAAVVPAP